MSTTVNGYDYSPYWLQTSNNTVTGSDVTTNAPQASVSVFADAGQTQSAAGTNNFILSDKCDDGKDDGKITLWSGICAFGKGVAKSALNTVVGIFTDPKKAIATVATAALCVAFPPAGVALGVVGAVTGGASLISSAKTAYNVYKNGGTDAETKAAIQDAGAATLQIGLSIAGTRASFKAMKGTSGSALNQLAKDAAESGTKAGFRATAKAFWKDVRTGGKGNGGEGYLGTRALDTVKTNWKTARNEGNGIIKSAGKTISKSVEQAGQKISDARMQRRAQKEWNKFDKADDAGKQQIVDNMDKQMTDAKAKVTEAERNLAKVKGESGVTEAEIQAAEARLKGAETNVKNLETFRQAVDDAGMKTIETQSKLETAKSNLTEAQKAVDNASKNGGKPTEVQLKALSDAESALKGAKANARLTSSNPIKYYGQQFANKAGEAGYTSGFGALTTPVTVANAITNADDMTLETAQYNAAQGNATFGSVTSSQGRTFNTQFEHRDYAAIAEQANADVMRTLNYYAY